MIKYNWICSNRKTMAIQIQVDGKVIVRTPWNVSKDQVEAFLEKKKKWIENKQKERSERPWNHSTFSEEEKEEGIQRALKVIPQRVKYYAQLMNVTYGKITIKEQKTRWGSCSSKGNLNFNWKLKFQLEACAYAERDIRLCSCA